MGYENLGHRTSDKELEIKKVATEDWNAAMSFVQNKPKTEKDILWDRLIKQTYDGLI